MLEKYKLCPCCGKKNYPGLIECMDCEQDLTQVALTDGEAESVSDTPSGDTSLVRVCDACFAKNPPNARKCLLCGEDIADILPTVDTGTVNPNASGGAGVIVQPIKNKNADSLPTVDLSEALETAETSDSIETNDTLETPDVLPVTTVNAELTALPFTVTLTSEDGSFTYTLMRERTVFGRSEEASEYLVAKPYVSRVHCAITVTREGVFFEDLNNTNYSFVNNTRAVGRVRLKNGDSLSFGGVTVGGKRQMNAAYFTVTVL